MSNQIIQGPRSRVSSPSAAAAAATSATTTVLLRRAAHARVPVIAALVPAAIARAPLLLQYKIDSR